MINGVQSINHRVGFKNSTMQSLDASIQESVAQSTPELVEVSPDLLRAYRGIDATKIFENVNDFIVKTEKDLEKYKDMIPENLYKKIKESIEQKDLHFAQKVDEYYAPLKDCQSLADVKNLYPEIKLPDLDLEDELYRIFKFSVPKSLCENVAKLDKPEEKRAAIDEYFAKSSLSSASTWKEIEPHLNKTQEQVTKDIIDGKIPGYDFKNTRTLFVGKMPAKFRLLNVPDREKVILSLIKQNYIENKPVQDCVEMTEKGTPIIFLQYSKYGELTPKSKKFANWAKNVETEFSNFENLKDLPTSEINSAIWSRTWRTSHMRADLGYEQMYGKPWSIIKPIWQKTMFPEQTTFPTDKMIDFYLVNLYRAGKREVECDNPIQKYIEASPYMDKNKIMLLKRLYKGTRHLDECKFTLKNPMYLAFKSQFDIEGMKKSIEELESHYKNAFFKQFWTDSRKERFFTALKENKELASKNIQLTDDILSQAMDSAFVE